MQVKVQASWFTKLRKGIQFAILFACFAAIFFPCLRAAQFLPPDPVYAHRLWQSEDGLPNNSVRGVIQSRDGYLWIATDGGLAKFDGFHFTDLERKAGAKRSRWIFGLAETRDGSIWSSSVNGGVVRVKEGRLTRYTTTNGLANDLVLAILEDSRDNLWFGTASGLCKFADNKFSSYTNYPGMIVEAVRAVLEDKKGNIWAGTAAGLNCLRPDGTAVSYTSKDLLVNDAVLSLHEDRQGVLWIGTSGGLTRVREGEAKHFTVRDGLLHNFVRRIMEDVEGNLWIGTQGGLQQLVEGGFRTVSINNLADPDLEGITYVYSICEDREGNIWVGNSVGLNRLRKQNFVTYTKDQGLPSNETTCVLEDKAGNLWIGTYGGGLCRMRGNEVEVFTTKEGLADNHVLSLYQDSTGAIWIGMDGAGVQRWKDGKFTHFTFADAKANVVRVIYGDSQHNIWLGSNLGVARHFRGKFDRKTGLSQNTIKAIVRDRKNHLWFTGESTLVRMGGNALTRSFSRADGFGITSGNAIYPDTEGCWVGTDEGLFFVRNDERVYNFAKSPSLGRDPILHILEDDMGRLWMSARHGVFVAPRTHLLSFGGGATSSVPLIQIGKIDGLKRAQSNGNGAPAGWKTRDGRILFATLHGIIAFDPKTIKTSENPLPVRIENIRLDGTDYPVQETIFPPGKGHVEFRYTALHFTAPEKINFKYMLEGFDQDWVDAGTRRSASYQLASGDYNFKVIACDRNGVWNQLGSSVKFSLQPHFYQTGWFYVLVIFLVAGSIVIIYRARQSEAKRREAELMRLIDVHTARYRNAAQSMASFNYSIAHDLRAPLRAIKGLTQALVEDIPETVNPETGEYTKRIVASVDRMDALITDLLTYGQLTHKEFQFAEVNVESVLNQALANLEAEIAMRHAKIKLEKPPGVIWGNETLLLQVFMNLITNSLKFVEKGKEPVIEIRSEVGSGKMKISVSDNGIGIDPRFHEKVFGVFERLHNTEQYPGTGIGLAIVHKSVEQMGGRVGLISQPGQGCCFWFELSLPKRAAARKSKKKQGFNVSSLKPS